MQPFEKYHRPNLSQCNCSEELACAGNSARPKRKHADGTFSVLTLNCVLTDIPNVSVNRSKLVVVSSQIYVDRRATKAEIPTFPLHQNLGPSYTELHFVSRDD